MSTVSSELGLHDVPVRELSADEGEALFERRCQLELGVSAAEFLAAIERGQLPSSWSPRSVARLEMLAPFAR